MHGLRDNWKEHWDLSYETIGQQGIWVTSEKRKTTGQQGNMACFWRNKISRPAENISHATSYFTTFKLYSLYLLSRAITHLAFLLLTCPLSREITRLAFLFCKIFFLQYSLYCDGSLPQGKNRQLPSNTPYFNQMKWKKWSS